MSGAVVQSEHWEYFEWMFAGKGVPWRMGGATLEEFEKMERCGWRVYLYNDLFILLRRRRRGN